jgi:hypothetical protein
MKLATIVAACFAASVIPLSSVQANEPEKLNEDTVLCLKNTSSEEAIAVVYESFWNANPNMRQVNVKPGKTSCLRYRSAKEVRPDFFFEDRSDEVKLRAFKGVCKRVKGRFAKYYEIGENAEGRRTCEIHEEKTSDEIRALVAEAKAINS